MSASSCMGHASRIVQLPREKWAAEIEKLPSGCDKTDCDPPLNCRERIRHYLKKQWYISQMPRRASK